MLLLLQPLPLVAFVCGELAVAALLKLLVLLYLVPPRARPLLGVSTSMHSDAEIEFFFVNYTYSFIKKSLAESIYVDGQILNLITPSA